MEYICLTGSSTSLKSSLWTFTMEMKLTKLILPKSWILLWGDGPQIKSISKIDTIDVEYVWQNVDTMLIQYWHSVETVLTKYHHDVDTLLTKCWHIVNTILAQCWHKVNNVNNDNNILWLCWGNLIAISGNCWQNLKNLTDWLTDSPTWIQEMLAHLKNETKTLCWKTFSIHWVQLSFMPLGPMVITPKSLFSWNKNYGCKKKAKKIVGK